MTLRHCVRLFSGRRFLRSHAHQTRPGENDAPTCMNVAQCRFAHVAAARCSAFPSTMCSCCDRARRQAGEGRFSRVFVVRSVLSAYFWLSARARSLRLICDAEAFLAHFGVRVVSFEIGISACHCSGVCLDFRLQAVWHIWL